MRKVLAILRNPVPAEIRSLLQARWEELPQELRTPWQIAGRHLVHCAYTMGASYCSFGCTHCYLPANANQAPIPSLDEMKAQIDANRRMIGPGGGLQITGGDVVDAYWRADRSEELVAILRHATDAGVVPMLMTHGQILLENPAYLARLVRDGGLRKLALHIDMTQAGRPGFPIRRLRSEVDLHPLRQAFADLVHRVRRETGLMFFAAHTVTVAERNLASIGEIVRWLVEDRRRLDVFHTVSFQTEADVGRTRFSESPVTPEAVWERIAAAAGVDLPADNLWLGHPDCSRMTTLGVVYPEGRIVNLIPAGRQDRAFWSALLQVFGGVGGRGEDARESALRKVAAVVRNPSILVRVAHYVGLRLARRDLRPLDLWHALRGRVRGLNVVLHNFMSSADLVRPRTEVVEKRLAACMFRGAVAHEGDWAAVPMCQMNVAEREAYYTRQIHGLR